MNGSKMKVVSGLALVAGLALLGNGARPDNCGNSGVLEVTSGGRGQCVNGVGGSMELEGALENCCSPDELFPSSTVTYGDEPCRVLESSEPFCLESPEDCVINEFDRLTISIETDEIGREDDCCENCLCYGDPQCISFNGTDDEWILCDARDRDLDSCDHTAKNCRARVDHQGVQCRWIKDTELWESWEKSGSPCQPDFTRDGFEWPTMTMHKRGDFEFILVLGERGIIREIRMTTSGGNAFSLTSENCVNLAEPFTDLSGNPVTPPTWWYKSVANPSKDVWTVGDDVLGIEVEIGCVQYGDGQNRLDIDNIYDRQPGADSSSGFCVEGSIESKSGSTTPTGYEECTLDRLPHFPKTCAVITGRPCGKRIKNDVKDWCRGADLSATSLAGKNSVRKCIGHLLKGSFKQKRDRWIGLICEMNGIPFDKCVADIAQFGWPSFFMQYSNVTSVDPYFQSQINSVASSQCGKKRGAAQSSSFSQNLDECRIGIDVEYLQDGEWKQSFHIPRGEAPCDLTILGDERPELFKYPIRLAQQCNKVSCHTNGRSMCQPLEGFNAALEFDGSCITSTPTALPTTSPTPPPVEQVPQVPNCTDAEVDLLFVVDESNSIGRGQWVRLYTFIDEVVSALPISAEKVRLALITFSSRIRRHIDFTAPESINKDAFMTYVEGIKQARHDTATPQALDKAQEVWSETPPRTPFTTRITAMLTDGEPHRAGHIKFCKKKYRINKADQCVQQQVTELQNDFGSKFLYVAIGDDANIDLFADLPDERFYAKDFDDLTNYVIALLQQICTFPASNP